MQFLGAAALRDSDARTLDEILERREMVVGFGEGELRGLGAATLLFADYAVLRRGATLSLDTPEAWAGAVWRVGRRALMAGAEDLVDEVTDLDEERWRANWLKGRSVLALDAAAVLVRSRGGDALERAEFARLFAIGEPRTGLGAFLAKKPASF